MKLTMEKAEEIRELFGPCTRLYECYGEAEFTEMLEENPDQVAGEFIRLELEVDLYMAEGMGCYGEAKAAHIEIKKRLRAAGYSIARRT